MAEYTALAPLFTDIANAIRSKTGETGQITASLFPQKIDKIELGAPEVSVTGSWIFGREDSNLPYATGKNIRIAENTEILVNCILITTNDPSGKQKCTIVTYKCLPNFSTQKGEYNITTAFINQNNLHIRIDSTIPDCSPQLYFLGLFSFV